MNYKAIIKKQSTIIAIAVICLTIATVGVSYALFFQVETNSNNQVVTAGSLDVSYGSGSSSITATELEPMSDDEALTSSTMTGTIYVENKGTLPANYEVAIGNDTESFNARADKLDTDELLSHEYLRIAAYKNGELVVSPTTLSTLTKSENNTELYKLFDGTLETTGTGNSTMTIVIKIWIDENAPEAIIGDYVYLKMDITSEVNEFLADGYSYESVSGITPLTLANSTGDYLANYKIYGNSVQNGTPNPDTPVEIESVGEKTKNLIDTLGRSKGTLSSGGPNTNVREFEFDKYYVGLTMNNYYYPYYINSYSVSDEGVTVNANSEGYGVAFPIQVKPNTTYSISKNSGSTIGIGFYTSSGEYITYTTNSTFTTPENCEIITVILRPSKGVETTYTNIQLEENATATDYEPYGYKIPIQVTGKNLFNVESWYNFYKNGAGSNLTLLTNNTQVDGYDVITWNPANGYNSAEGKGIVYPFSGKENTQYTIAYDCRMKSVATDTVSGFSFSYSDGTSSSFYCPNDTNWNQVVSTSTAGKTVIGLRLSYHYGGTVIARKDTLRLYEGAYTSDNIPGYVPYEEETTNVYLDEPLRKLGDYKDYIDFGTNTVVRNVKSVVFTGSDSESWKANDNSLTNTYRVYINLSDAITGGTGVPILSNKFIALTSGTSSTDTENMQLSSNNLFVRVLRSRLTGTTADAFKTWAASNNFEVIYPLADKDTQPIDLPEIKTVSGTATLNVLTTIAPSDLEITYVKKD